MPWSKSKNPEVRRAAKARYKAKYPGKIQAKARATKRRKFLREMGIDEEIFQTVCRLQEGKCGICGKIPPNIPHEKLVPDHNHTTHLFRGVICGRCNKGLGLLGDTLQDILNAAEYLRIGESL